MKIEVLPPHGYVRLVSYMQPVPIPIYNGEDPGPHHFEGRPQGEWTGDLEIVRNARVSYDADWRAPSEDVIDRAGHTRKRSPDEKLLKYMFENGHTSPFEAMVFTFEIKCPLFIARQWHRHRTWSYNEVSARYTELPEEFYVPEASLIGKQHPTNRQSRSTTFDDNTEAAIAARWANEKMYEHGRQAFLFYREFLKAGIPRELARSVLPLSTYTRFFGTVDLHNLAHFIRLRADSHAQWEIQRYAQALLELIEPVVPISAGLIRRDIAGEVDSDRKAGP